MRLEVKTLEWIYPQRVRIKESPSNNGRGTILLNTLAAVTIPAIFLALFISSYFNWSITSIISYPTKDGWCDTTTTGVGDHCFGDFFAPVLISNDEPWSQGINPNPPVAMNIFRIFQEVSVITTLQVSLFTWLILITICTFFPLIHLSRQIYLTSETKWKITLIYSVSTPVIVALDRGNIICLTLPLVYLFMMQINAKPRYSLYLLVVAALIKPQLLIFSLLILKVNGLKSFVKALGIWLVLFLASFFTYGNIRRDLSNYTAAISQYSDYATRGKIYPVNLSLRNTLDIISNALGQSIGQNLITVVAYCILGAFLMFTLLNVKQLTNSRLIWNLTLIMISIIGTSFSYYSIYILLAFVVIIATNNYSDLFDSKVRFTLFLSIVILLLPLHALSWKLIPFFREYGQTQVSMTWSIGQVFILCYIIFEIATESKKYLANTRLFLGKRV